MNIEYTHTYIEYTHYVSNILCFVNIFLNIRDAPYCVKKDDTYCFYSLSYILHYIIPALARKICGILSKKLKKLALLKL